MHFFKHSIFFLLIFLLLTSTKSSHDNSEMSDYCSMQICKYDEPMSRYVQFPFLIKNDSLPSFCGYPGFDLFCNGDDKLLIELPNLGAFSVEEIDYVKQELWLNDPDYCLPRKYLQLNGSSFEGKSPKFLPTMEQTYWLFNCSNDFFNTSNDINVEPIECLSGTSYGVFATHVENITQGNSSTTCSRIGPIKVPNGRFEGNSSSNLSGDIRLSWSKPHECRTCHERDGRCRFKSNSNFLEVECFFPRHGLTRNAMVAIGLAFTAPLALVMFIIIYFIVKSVNRQGRGAGARAGATHTPQPENVTHGLDHDVIESYPKVILGESRRLPKPDDVHCPICLGEYVPKESLRTLPDCGHYFHADCVDGWLHLNASCPVCRKNPSNKLNLSQIDA